MTLDVDVPTQPDLTNRGVPAGTDTGEPGGSEFDFRREELERVLDDGAWREGFEEWAAYTDLSAADVRRADDLGLFRALDFYWDPEEGRLRYVTSQVPEEWEGDGDGASRSLLQAELDDLGRTVAETAADYVEWSGAESPDLVWGVETFGQVPTDDGE